MKTSYELAMERLNQATPAAKLTAEQKKRLAELDSLYTAKVAEREIALSAEIAKVAGDDEKAQPLREQLNTDRRKLQAELEERKERVRQDL
jgi:hypothetical protein